MSNDPWYVPTGEMMMRLTWLAANNPLPMPSMAEEMLARMPAEQRARVEALRRGDRQQEGRKPKL